MKLTPHLSDSPRKCDARKMNPPRKACRPYHHARNLRKLPEHMNVGVENVATVYALKPSPSATSAQRNMNCA